MRYQLVTGSEPTAFLGTLQATHTRSGIDRLLSREDQTRTMPHTIGVYCRPRRSNSSRSLSACCRAASPKAGADRPSECRQRLARGCYHRASEHSRRPCCECRADSKSRRHVAGKSSPASPAKHSTAFTATSGGQNRDVHARNLPLPHRNTGGKTRKRIVGLLCASNVSNRWPFQK
jgi:hypothetical protein